MKKYIQPRSEAIRLHLEDPILGASSLDANNHLPSVDDENNLFSGNKGWNSANWTENE